MDRARRLMDQVGVSATSSAGRSDNDVVVVAAVRTPVTRAKRGAFASTSATTMLTAALAGVLKASGVDPSLVEDIAVGTVLAPGSSRANEARIAAFLAGFPESTCVRTVNRQCSSGLQAIADIASSIQSGYIQVGIGAGVESMTTDAMAWGGKIDLAAKQHPKARNCMIPMGITSDNVAKQFGVDRQTQDALSVKSHARAAKATATGRFKDEIVPVETEVKDPKTGAVKKVVVSKDDGIRETSAEALAALKPVFTKDGTTTAGNSSQVSDGAAATLLMSRATARRLGLKHIGVLRSFAVAGVPPEIMGVGPAYAIPAAVKKAGLSLNQVDLFEINEAFASQATYCVNKLGLSWDKVNVNGGAIALGHPLGCTGSRMTATLLHEMAKRRARFGVVSMCIGSGMGAAAVYERE
ncbi:acetyl-CoA C-acyltransferase [Plasmodiophora brassicae]